jgi:hypothetical protein
MWISCQGNDGNDFGVLRERESFGGAGPDDPSDDGNDNAIGRGHRSERLRFGRQRYTTADKDETTIPETTDGASEWRKIADMT